jgi:hypothetical protein
MKPKLEIQDVFRRHAADYLERFKPSYNQHKTLRAIMNCRSAAPSGEQNRKNAARFFGKGADLKRFVFRASLSAKAISAGSGDAGLSANVKIC